MIKFHDFNAESLKLYKNRITHNGQPVVFKTDYIHLKKGPYNKLFNSNDKIDKSSIKIFINENEDLYNIITNISTFVKENYKTNNKEYVEIIKKDYQDDFFVKFKYMTDYESKQINTILYDKDNNIIDNNKLHEYVKYNNHAKFIIKVSNIYEFNNLYGFTFKILKVKLKQHNNSKIEYNFDSD
jgi:hypothetical protein